MNFDRETVYVACIWKCVDDDTMLQVCRCYIHVYMYTYVHREYVSLCIVSVGLQRLPMTMHYVTLNMSVS